MPQPPRDAPRASATQSSSPAGGAYLLLPGFQLKYTAVIVGVAAVLMLALSVAILKINDGALLASRVASVQAERALRESQTSSRIVRLSQLEGAAQDPVRAGTIDRQAERDVARVREEREEITRANRRVLVALVAGAALLMVALAALGILVTRRVVAPMARLKRLLRKVTAGRLDIAHAHGHGDELSEMFTEFMAMVEALKHAQRSEIAKLVRTIDEAEAAGVPSRIVAQMRELKGDMEVALEPPEATLTTMKLAAIRELLAKDR